MGWEIDGVTLEQREAVQPPPPLGEAAAAAGLIDDLQSPGSKKRHLLICKLFFPQVPSLKPNGVGIDRRSSRVWSFCGPRSLLLPELFFLYFLTQSVVGALTFDQENCDWSLLPAPTPPKSPSLTDETSSTPKNASIVSI